MEQAVLTKLLKINAFAEELNVQPSTVRAWVLARRITVVRVGRRAIRIPASEVARIVEQGTIPAKKSRQ